MAIRKRLESDSPGCLLANYGRGETRFPSDITDVVHAQSLEQFQHFVKPFMLAAGRPHAT